ncbi:unnamed protein product [marine sediment metagenome]|uniref:Uncharacterized protein n=1 Tax=marine sediment metagenome TaxID=412755 RepID=X1HJV3_9ZZZZ
MLTPIGKRTYRISHPIKLKGIPPINVQEADLELGKSYFKKKKMR